MSIASKLAGWWRLKRQQANAMLPPDVSKETQPPAVKDFLTAQSRFTTAQIDELVAIALREVGVKEVGGNNCGPRIRQYQAATWLEPGAWPWCAAFVCWCIQHWRFTDGDLPRFNRPRTAGAFDFERWALEESFPVFGENEWAKKGDIIVFDFSHIGIVAADRAGDYLQTIEGNTHAEGSREGDGVWEKRRHWKLARSFVRFGW